MNPMSISDNTIEKSITFFRSKLNEDFFNDNEEMLVKLSTYATPLAAAIGFLISFVAAVKLDSLMLFLAGPGWVVLVALSYFIGSRFLESCKSVIKNNPSTLSNPEFLNASALIMITSLILVLVVGLYMSINLGVSVLYVVIPIAIALLYFITLVLNPKLISTEIKDDATAGEDALAILVIQFKGAVKLAGVIFGSMTLIGSVFLVYALFSVFTEEAFISGFANLLGGAYLVISGLLYPFIIYISFVFFYLLADLCMAILTLHKK